MIKMALHVKSFTILISMYYTRGKMIFRWCFQISIVNRQIFFFYFQLARIKPFYFYDVVQPRFSFMKIFIYYFIPYTYVIIK